MRFSRPVEEATLIKRYKRFLADIRLSSGEEVTAHCPNPGSMAACMEPNGRILVSDHQGSKRKLRYGWELSYVGDTWVLINTTLANAVVGEALTEGKIAELAGYESHRAEVKYGEKSRIDFLLESEGRPPCWLEVKNATLKEGDVSYFPDGVTARGSRHLVELSKRVAAGDRAVCLFLISRGDTRLFRPATRIDPDYAECLKRAAQAGVEILAYRALCTPDGVTLENPVPLDLDPGPTQGGPLPKGKTKPNRPKGGYSFE